MSFTIAAIASGIAPGGVGVIRISGPQAKRIAHKIFIRAKSKSQGLRRSHRMYYGQFTNLKGDKIDNGMAVWLSAPKTYTGEDTVEFFPHGSLLIMKNILEACFEAGAAPAKPGEFTQRAFLNGKIDLTQAEAVAELINAESEQASMWAQKRLNGELRNEIEKLYLNCTDVLAECEADIDFPDENLPLAERETLNNKIQEINLSLDAFLASYRSVEKLNEGFEIVFLGPPNVGKSSLFNALLSQERAIVSTVAGTTRDALREDLNIDGFKVKIVDSAGIRVGTDDYIEQAGIQLSWQIADRADLVCILVSADISRDQQRYFLSQVESYVKRNPRKGMVWVENKRDLQQSVPSELIPLILQKLDRFEISAKERQGVSQLRDAIAEYLHASVQKGAYFGGIQNNRQKALFDAAKYHFDQAIGFWQQGEATELAALELRETMGKLGEILGKTDLSEDVLDRIFSQFCIGK